MSVKCVKDIHEYREYINSFIGDEKYSDPHLTARIEVGESLDDMIAKKDHHCFVTDDRGKITGLYILLIISEEKYLEMLIGIRDIAEKDTEDSYWLWHYGRTNLKI